MGVKRISFNKTCATGGTSERLVLPSNDIRTRAYMIQALPTNTGFVRVGGSDVSSTNGAYLDAKDMYHADNVNYLEDEAETRLSAVYIVCEIDGEGVNVTYELGDELL